MWQKWFSCHKELLLKERIGSLWEPILSFKRSSHYEKGHNWRESLPDPVVSFDVGNFFNVLATSLNLHISIKIVPSKNVNQIGYLCSNILAT